MTPRVLVVDDEVAIRSFLVETLRHESYSVEEVGTADGALLLAASLRPDVILLDLGLPDLDGKEVIRRIRVGQSTPIIIISARDQESEKVAALDSGADDYLTKPFGSGELIARIKVALRHRLREQGPITTQAFGDLVWQPEQQQVLRRGEALHLTPMEYKLFQFLASSPGRVLTYGTLLREVWGHSSLEQAQSVRVTVAALRRKLQESESGIRYIGTEVGTGYRFLAPKQT
jgi:two-component system KDP operon response regulator KdpE